MPCKHYARGNSATWDKFICAPEIKILQKKRRKRKTKEKTIVTCKKNQINSQFVLILLWTELENGLSPLRLLLLPLTDSVIELYASYPDSNILLANAGYL